MQKYITVKLFVGQPEKSAPPASLASCTRTVDRYNRIGEGSRERSERLRTWARSPRRV